MGVSPLPPSAPGEADLPPGELGEMIKLGRELMEQTNTHPLTKPYVGNSLRCSSCHLNAGTHPQAATLTGTATVYPAYSPREKAVITLEDRVLNCFMRSMNGTRPPTGSKLSIALTSYITWLSQGLPMKMNPKAPLGPYSFPKLNVDAAKADVARGEQLYAQKCVVCHGAGGQGVGTFPPVWGPKSYNMGAGLADTLKLASWLKVAMPLGNPNLTHQEALDIAAYTNSQPRDKFVLKERLPAADRLGTYNSNVFNKVKEVRPHKKP